MESMNDVARRNLPSDIQLCEACGHIQMSAFTDPDYIYETYLSRPATTNSSLKSSYQEYARQLFELFETPLVLEVGSNDGLFLEILGSEGISAVGIEPAQNLVTEANKRNVSTVKGYVDADSVQQALSQLGAPPNIIIANHSFSNVEDIRAWASALSRFLPSDGYLVIQTFYQLDVLRNNLIENYNHEHLSYCTVRSLSAFLSVYGFRLSTAKHLDAKGGSIRCFFKKTTDCVVVDDDTAKLLDQEERFYGSLEAHFAATSGYIREKRNALAKIMHSMGADGSLAAYGTSIGATVFSYQFGLAEKIKVFFDDDVMRQNRYSPGYGIPVLPGRTTEMNKYSHCIILAPLYADAIIRNNHDYLRNGGTFLKFWPEIEQVTWSQ